jgi:hypothetical protein
MNELVVFIRSLLLMLFVVIHVPWLGKITGWATRAGHRSGLPWGGLRGLVRVFFCPQVLQSSKDQV